jgi:hypothetical protein
MARTAAELPAGSRITDYMSLARIIHEVQARKTGETAKWASAPTETRFGRSLRYDTVYWPVELRIPWW